MFNMGPNDYRKYSPGARIGIRRRDQYDPDSGNPQGRRGTALWVVGVFLIGILSAAALIYWGYFAPILTWCNTQLLFPGELCDYSIGILHHQFDYSQALAVEVFKQWIDRIIGVVWALLTVRFVMVRLRENAAIQSSAEPPSQLQVAGAPPSTDASAYLRDRMFSTLSTMGMVLCGLGVLAILVVPPEIFPM